MKSVATSAALVLVLALSACGDDGGGSDAGVEAPRPSADAIVASLDGAQFAADLDEDEVRCFADAMHDGSLPDSVLAKLVNNQNLDEAELAVFHPAASDAAAACGFTYLAP